jgi:hypothetical protein
MVQALVLNSKFSHFTKYAQYDRIVEHLHWH